MRKYETPTLQADMFDDDEFLTESITNYQAAENIVNKQAGVSEASGYKSKILTVKFSD